jgi:hypothetical protein
MTVISIRPTIVDLELERGDAAPFTLTALDKAGGPLNLAGCQIALTMRKYLRGVWEDAPVAVALSWTEGNPNGISVSDLASGIVSITIPNETMATLATAPNAKYRYDVEITDAAGDPVTTHEGDVSVFADVTV